MSQLLPAVSRPGAAPERMIAVLLSLRDPLSRLKSKLSMDTANNTICANRQQRYIKIDLIIYTKCNEAFELVRVVKRA